MAHATRTLAPTRTARKKPAPSRRYLAPTPDDLEANAAREALHAIVNRTGGSNAEFTPMVPMPVRVPPMTAPCECAASADELDSAASVLERLEVRIRAYQASASINGFYTPGDLEVALDDIGYDVTTAREIVSSQADAVRAARVQS